MRFSSIFSKFEHGSRGRGRVVRYSHFTDFGELSGSDSDKHVVVDLFDDDLTLKCIDAQLLKWCVVFDFL